jgi:hypothetical protein
MLRKDPAGPVRAADSKRAARGARRLRDLVQASVSSVAGAATWRHVVLKIERGARGFA